MSARRWSAVERVVVERQGGGARLLEAGPDAAAGPARSALPGGEAAG